MPVKLSLPSDNIKQLLLRGLADFLEPNERVLTELRDGRTGLQVASLGLDEIAAGAPVRQAHTVGWQFLAGKDEASSMAAQIEQMEGGSEALAGLAQGHEIFLLIKALNSAETLDQVLQADFDFEPWLLRIPGILLEALWLKAAKAEDDLVIVFHTASKKLNGPTAPYKGQDFIDAVKPLAEAFRGFDQQNSKKY